MTAKRDSIRKSQTEKIIVRVSQALTLYIFVLASISVSPFGVALFVVIMCGIVMAYLEARRKGIIDEKT